MEVGHHPQVEKKNFKQYFLEFLMIFLAVTMGLLQKISVNILAINQKKKNTWLPCQKICTKIFKT